MAALDPEPTDYDEVPPPAAPVDWGEAESAEEDATARLGEYMLKASHPPRLRLPPAGLPKTLVVRSPTHARVS